MKRHIHHTAQAILNDEEEEIAFSAFEDVARKLTQEDNLPVGKIFRGLFVMGILAIHQLTGRLNPSRVLFENVLRKTSLLFYPEQRNTSILPLFPDDPRTSSGDDNEPRNY